MRRRITNVGRCDSDTSALQDVLTRFQWPRVSYALRVFTSIETTGTAQGMLRRAVSIVGGVCSTTLITAAPVERSR
jgi:hypothetical protein